MLEEPESPPPPPTDPLRPPLPPTWRERVTELVERGHELAASPARVAALLLLAAGVGLASYVVLRPPPARTPVEATLPLAAPPDPPPATTAQADIDTAPVVVHAAGAVVRPGVYTLSVADRVDDLIAAAGGLAADADVDRINLAAPLADGQRVYVPRIGEAAPPAPAGGTAGDGTAEQPGPVDLNTATVDQLDALPGIGPATAQAIVSHRETHGPFKAVDDLLDVRGIGPAKLEQLRPLVTV